MIDEIDFQIDETYACFGRAAHSASILEMTLMHALLLLDFMRQVGRKMVDDKGRIIDAKKYKHELHEFTQLQTTKTMGALLGEIQRLRELSPDLKKRIRQATKQRNFLIHRFWQDNNSVFATSQGRAKMIDQLEQYEHGFDKLSNDLAALLDVFFDRLGLGRSQEINREVDKWLVDTGLTLIR